MRLDWIGENIGFLGELTLTHVRLSWMPIVVALVVSLPLGWWAAHTPRVRGLILGVSGILYAIPSLALFVVLPLVIGTSVLSPLNVVVALSLYGIALQVRSTADAFAGVDTAPVDAAVAVGYPGWRRVLGVELPLAGPVILAGLRVVSASTISLVSVGALIGVRSLGTLFTDGFQRSFPTEIIAGVVLTVAVALIFDLVLIVIGKILMPWESR